MTERGIRFELVNKDSVPNTPKLHSTFEMDSIWKPLPDDMKIAMGKPAQFSLFENTPNRAC